MNEEDYTELLPDQPPEGMMQWMFSKGYFNKRYIVYRAGWEHDYLEDRKIKVVKCHCTECKQYFYQSYVPINTCAPAPFGWFNEVEGKTVMSGDKTRCPVCGTTVKVLHCNNISRYGYVCEERYLISLHIVENNLTLVCWKISQIIDKEGNETIRKDKYEAYIFKKRKCLKYQGYYRWFSQYCQLEKWERKSRCTDGINVYYPENVYPWDADILHGTEVENCKLDLYMSGNERRHPVAYMKCWQKHKNIENLVMAGVLNLVDNIVSRHSDACAINWKEKKPHKMLGLNKEEFRYAKKQEWLINDIQFYIEAKNNGITLKDMPVIEKQSQWSIRLLFGRGINVMRAIRYVEKQKKRYKRADIQYLVDYWSMAEKLGDDMSDEKVLYPHKLKNAHDEALKLQTYAEQKELTQKFNSRYKELEKFCYSDGELSIHPARDEKEMIIEGKTLHHCVATYAKKHAEGKTSIFFIRKVEDEESPYYTLELNKADMTVLQNRGRDNCARTNQVREFENKWLEHIKSIAN